MTALQSIPAAEPLANVEGEYALITVLLQDTKRIDPVADILRAEHFSDAFFGRMFDLIVREHGRGNSLSMLTIRPLIENDPGCGDGGVNQLLAGMGGTAILLADYKTLARQIRDMSRRRDLVAGLSEAAAMGRDLGATVETVIDAAETALVSVTASSDDVRQMSGAAAMSGLLKRLESPRRSIRSRALPVIDELIGGMRPTEMIVGGGRPGMGKTASALSYSLGAAQNGHGVLFISLEMSGDELAARMAADLAFNGHGGVHYADINADNPSPTAIRAIQDAKRKLDDLPFHLIDAGELKLSRLELLVRRYKRRFAARGQSLDLVVVDYLQLLRCDDRHRSAYEAVSEISRRLKAMAKDHEVAVFALAQLSREVERRPDKRPQVSDLRESGQIEQDADTILMFYRHEYYVRQDPVLREDPAVLGACEGAIDFIAGKVRRGVTGSALGRFHGAYQAVRG